MLGVQLAEPLDDLVAALDRLGRQRLEETPPDDLERLLGRRRAPRRVDPVDDVLERLERLLAALAADLDRRRRQRHDEERARDLVDGAGELLGEREGGVERAARQVVLAPLEPGVGHPFVDEDDDGGMGREERAESVGAGRDAGPVGLGDGRERRRAAERQASSPHSVRISVPSTIRGVIGESAVPTIAARVTFGQRRHLRLGEHALEPGQARDRRSPGRRGARAPASSASCRRRTSSGGRRPTRRRSRSTAGARRSAGAGGPR